MSTTIVPITPEAPQKGASVADRTVITNIAHLKDELATWRGMSFAVDLETTGLDSVKDRIIGMALHFADERTYYLVFEHTLPRDDGTYPSVKYIPRDVALKLLAPLFAQDGIEVIAHNAKFELHFLRRAGIEITATLQDTQLMAQILDENRRVGLKALCHLVGMDLDEYGSLEHYPGFRKEEILGVPLDAVAQYAMDDVEATWRLWEVFRDHREHDEVREAYDDIWIPLLFSLQQMEARGIAMDLDRVREAHARYTQKAEDAYWAIWEHGVEMVMDAATKQDWQTLAKPYVVMLKDVEEYGSVAGDVFTVRGKDLPIWREGRKLPRVPWFNPGSSAQIGQMLFGWLDLQAPEDILLNHTASGDISADKDTLMVLKHSLGEQAPEVLNHILAHRKATKLLSTYLKVYLEKTDPDDHACLRTNFNQTATDTGRLSSSKPNLQNQPARGEEGKLIRDLFVARPGHKLIVADYSMMELRMAAHYSRDAAMMEAFAKDLDLHTLTAAQQIGTSYDALLERLANGDGSAKMARSIGKTSNFGLLYGMGALAFQRYLLVNNGIKVTESAAQELIDAFNHTYDGVTRWKQSIEGFAIRHGYVPTIGGRRRRFPHLSSLPHGGERSKQLRQAVNAVIQGSCADIINGAIPRIQEMFVGYGGSLLLQVHDELVGEVPEGYAREVAHLMERMMVEPINPHLCVPLVCEAGIGPSWGAAK